MAEEGTIYKVILSEEESVPVLKTAETLLTAVLPFPVRVVSAVSINDRKTSPFQNTFLSAMRTCGNFQKERTAQTMLYSRFSEQPGKASGCIGCKPCEKMCPQFDPGMAEKNCCQIWKLSHFSVTDHSFLSETVYVYRMASMPAAYPPVAWKNKEK